MKSPSIWRRIRRAAHMLRSDEHLTRELIDEIDRRRPLVEAMWRGAIREE